jgi:hypothetical protein
MLGRCGTQENDRDLCAGPDRLTFRSLSGRLSILFGSFPQATPTNPFARAKLAFVEMTHSVLIDR